MAMTTRHPRWMGQERSVSVPIPPMTWDCSHELSRIVPASQGRSLADVPSGKRSQISDYVVRSSFLDHVKSCLAPERTDWVILDVAKRRCRIAAQVNSGLKYAHDVARKFLRAPGTHRAEVPRCEHVRDGTLGFITEPGQGVDKILLVCDGGAGHPRIIRQTTVAHMPEFAGILIDCLSLLVSLVVAPPPERSTGSTSRVTIYFSDRPISARGDRLLSGRAVARNARSRQLRYLVHPRKMRTPDLHVLAPMCCHSTHAESIAASQLG